MSDQPTVAILGSGSWATALAKLVLNNQSHVNWFVRSEEDIAYFLKYKYQRYTV